MVLKMKEGKTPQQACEEALHMIVDRYRKVNPGFFPSEKFVAINKSRRIGLCNNERESENLQCR